MDQGLKASNLDAWPSWTLGVGRLGWIADQGRHVASSEWTGR
ncbi:unnamed protein product, partial [Cuscuta campestris]